MDNLYFKKLPSDELPTVTGDDVVVAETASGLLYRIDSGGAKRIVDVDTAFPVNIVVEQHYGEPTPAERFGGTWEIDTDYAGRTTIGAGNGYEFGATGGTDKLIARISGDAAGAMNFQYTPVGLNWTSNYYTTPSTGAGGTSSETHNDGIVVAGKNTDEILSPYLVVNYWKRVA